MATNHIADLIDRAQGQDPEAFDVLVDAYGDRLYGYFYRLVGTRHDAEDLLQELFVRLVRKIGDYRHEDRFDAWLFRIATNLVRDRIRRMRKRGSTVSEWAGGDGQEGGLRERPDLDAVDPVESASRAEQVDRMQWALTRLPEAEREVICLRHFSQLSFREIAETMDTPLGTALARGHRGLARLRELMGDE